MGSKDDRSHNAGTADERIAKVLDRLHDVLVDDLGFVRNNTGDKYRLTSVADDGRETKITARSNYTHGEGRIVVEIDRLGQRIQRAEVKVHGSISVTEEAHQAGRKLTLIVRRATGQRTEDVA